MDDSLPEEMMVGHDYWITRNGVSPSNKRRKCSRFKNREHINNYIMAQNTWKEKLQEVRSFVKESR